MDRLILCKICGKKFCASVVNKLCCSEECSKKALLLYYKKYYIDRREKIISIKREKYLKRLKLNPNLGKEIYQKRAPLLRQLARERYRTDITYRFKTVIGTRFRQTIRGKYISQSIEKLIGCNINTLKHYLEDKFQIGMNWNNYGYYGWHIDHIIPCSSFDLTKEDEQKRCYHYTNLQPLWRYENQSKQDKIILQNG